ncbi:MAG: VCBS repeat-containing protein [Verrucomicrobia bacterium]|nr:VCBS repeat-containing protein [Verrucomicrobiota bacterium]
MAQPVITQNPTNYSVSIGANVTFSVVVDPSSLPATYQWQKDSANLAEATDRLLTLTNVQPSLAGSYRVTVRNGSGSVTSEPGTLSVDNSFTKITSGPIVTEAGISVGCAWGDYNNDGWIDLFVIRGSVLEKSQNMLYQNNGDGTFTKVTTGAVATDTSNSLGATWGDYDNDGRLDLFVARAGGQTNALYRNLGDGTFTSVTSASFALRGGRTQAGVWGDFDNDGNLDLFLTGRDTSLNSLYQNSGNGTFVKVTQNVFGVLWSGNYRPGIWGDYDNDGDLDIFLISFASTSNWLFRNQGDGVFIPTNGGEAVVASSGSRGAAWADFDNDGDLDMFVANAVGRGNRLYQNNGNGTFSRLPAPTLPVSLANSAYPAWGDYDNDGFIDLFVPNGESTGDNNTLYHYNGDGTFNRVETGSLVNDAGHSVACGWADFDNYGVHDLFVGNLPGETNFLFRSNGNENHWL